MAVQEITVRLLSGEHLNVEVRSCNGYALYRAVRMALPDEIRPYDVHEMTLFLQGEMVPKGYETIVLSEETYDLLIDAVRYEVWLDDNGYDARIIRNARIIQNTKTYHFFEMVVECIGEEDVLKTIRFPLLFDPDTGGYYDLDGVEQEQIGRMMYVELPEDAREITGAEIISVLMSHLMEKVSPSVSGEAYLRDELELQITVLEEM